MSNAATSRFPSGVVISADDIAWFRACRSLWVDGENGAPAIFPAGITPERLATMKSEEYDAFTQRLEPIQYAFFLHASFSPGQYSFASPLERRSEITVTADDIKLLQVANWRTFAIDNQRPYGDFTNYVIDMARALGLPVTINPATDYAEISAEDDKRMEELHRKMQFVVQAYLEHAQLAPGAWFIPAEGWGISPVPRCRPLSAAAIAAYRAAPTGGARRAALFE